MYYYLLWNIIQICIMYVRSFLSCGDLHCPANHNRLDIECLLSKTNELHYEIHCYTWNECNTRLGAQQKKKILIIQQVLIEATLRTVFILGNWERVVLTTYLRNLVTSAPVVAELVPAPTSDDQLIRHSVVLYEIFSYYLMRSKWLMYQLSS